jgi:hypothetical protein
MKWTETIKGDWKNAEVKKVIAKSSYHLLDKTFKIKSYSQLLLRIKKML